MALITNRAVWIVHVLCVVGVVHSTAKSILTWLLRREAVTMR